MDKLVHYITDVYLTAKEFVIGCGYWDELDWQETRHLNQLTESDFLKESAWVILSSGMRETVVRKYFSDISDAFFNWKSAAEIVKRIDHCFSRAVSFFNHPQKIKAIVSICEKINELSFDHIREKISLRGVDFLKTFDYIGPVTSYHLAKNIGCDVVKPDRHLVRISQAAQYDTPYDLCSIISDMTGDKLSVVDLVLWRYATLNENYLEVFDVSRVNVPVS